MVCPMATETRTVQVCDVCGATTDNPSLRFGWGSAFYEADLCDKHGKEFREMAETIIESARRLGVDAPKTKQTAVTKPFMQPTPKIHTNRIDTAAVRQWAKSKGMKVPERGRLPKALIEQYNADH